MVKKVRKTCRTFPTPKSDRQRTTFHHTNYQNSPARNHGLHPIFAKNPCKNAYPPRPGKSAPKSTFEPLQSA
jgi:hypothetical protein